MKQYFSKFISGALSNAVLKATLGNETWNIGLQQEFFDLRLTLPAKGQDLFSKHFTFKTSQNCSSSTEEGVACSGRGL